MTHLIVSTSSSQCFAKLYGKESSMYSWELLKVEKNNIKLTMLWQKKLSEVADEIIVVGDTNRYSLMVWTQQKKSIM